MQSKVFVLSTLATAFAAAVDLNLSSFLQGNSTSTTGTNSLVPSGSLLVYLPGATDPEYTATMPLSIPACNGNSWTIPNDNGNNQYDQVIHCTSDPTIQLSVNPFRCISFSSTPNANGIYECDQCAVSFGHFNEPGSDSKNIAVVTGAVPSDVTVDGYFVPQVVEGMKSCLYVEDPNLISICPSIIRDSITQTTSASCVKADGTQENFQAPIHDSDQCKSYTDDGSNIVCSGN